MQVIQTAALIQKAITSIQGRGAKLDGDIHVAGVSVLKHIAEHRDTTLADKLVQAMPKGGRKNALVAWLLAFGTVVMLDRKADKGAIAAGRLFKISNEKKFDEAEAIATVWTEFKPESDPLTEFDVQAATKALIARFTKAQAEKLTVPGKAEALAMVEAFAATLRG